VWGLSRSSDASGNVHAKRQVSAEHAKKQGDADFAKKQGSADFAKKQETADFASAEERALKGTEVVDEGLGVTEGHAYAVVRSHAVREESEAQLMQLRNPWGEFEWGGAWSDGDEKNWTPALATELAQEKDDDGDIHSLSLSFVLSSHLSDQAFFGCRGLTLCVCGRPSISAVCSTRAGRSSVREAS
jgi:hypothetical protein